ncbi:MAG: ribonuclease [Betaproteobacteria bacterium]|nr:ribonuclease [Betaproteobacteria bacterium]MCL2886442.1 ribonuclease [Betaproteobacteria bacterium]
MHHCWRFLIVLLLTLGSAFSGSPSAGDWIAAADLPPEARQTLALIQRGGPFPYNRDGVIFNNFEKRLPLQPRGHYREYTVKTPGRKDRGPRRIIAGRDGAYYYTADHYRTFRHIRE